MPSNVYLTVTENNLSIEQSGEPPRIDMVVASSGGGTLETPATIKTKYESNANTNEFDDAEKLKLATLTLSDITDNATAISHKQDDLSGLAITQVTKSTGDKVLIQDASDSDNLKWVAESELGAVEFFDTEFRIVDNTSGFKTSFELSELTADRVITAPDFDFDFNDYFDSSGNTITISSFATTSPKIYTDANGVLYITTGGNYANDKEIRLYADGVQFYRSNGTLLEQWRNGIRTAYSNYPFQYDSDIENISSQDAGFIVNNKNTTTKHIIEFQSAGVQKAYIDASGTFFGGVNSVRAYSAKTANYTMIATDSIIECTANSFTVTLLTTGVETGQQCTILNSGAGTITLTNSPLAELYLEESADFIWNGAVWRLT